MKEIIAFGIGLVTGAIAMAVYNDEKDNGPIWYTANEEAKKDK